MGTLEIIFRPQRTNAKTNSLGVTEKNGPYIGGYWKEFSPYKIGQNATLTSSLKDH